jgi:c-di-GMP-binding flagellar brake protein YcgR
METPMPTKTAEKRSQLSKKRIVLPVTINRRKEWRFQLPLSASIEGKLPQGKVFKETAKLENISSGGAYFLLDSAIVVGSKLKLCIDLPKEATDGRKVRLLVVGLTIRLQKPERRGKKQGVAVRFGKDYRFIAGAKKSS